MPAAEVPDPVLTVEEVASQLRVTTETVRRLIRAGTIKAFRVGRAIRIPTSSLDEFRARNQVVVPKPVVAAGRLSPTFTSIEAFKAHRRALRSR